MVISVDDVIFDNIESGGLWNLDIPTERVKKLGIGEYFTLQCGDRKLSLRVKAYFVRSNVSAVLYFSL